jgi:SAM-dependent methyltransferase
MMKSFRKSKDLAITGANARWYDKNSRETRLAEMERYAREVAVFLPAGAAVLEVAPGPGYLSIALSRMFDGIVCTAAFKNFREPMKALKEMYRVLKPGGTALIIDMNPQISSQQIFEYVRGQMHMKGLSVLFMRFMFRHFLSKGAYSREDIATMLRDVPWRDCRIWEEDITLHVRMEK